MRLSLTHKIVSGYLVVAISFAICSCYALYSFRLIHSRLERSSMTAVDALQSLQELKAGLLSIDRVARSEHQTSADSPKAAFEMQRRGIESTLARIVSTDPSLSSLSGETSLYLQALGEARFPRTGRVTRGEAVAEPDVRPLVASLTVLQARKRQGLRDGLDALDRSAEQAYDTVLRLTLIGVGIGLLPAFFVPRRFKRSLGKLGDATQMIADGAFDYDPGVQSSDELGELAAGLKNMAQKLKNYEQLCLDASPLTRLPGNIAIERALLEIIRRNERFALCYADLDDFKAFNDTYGYAKGSEVIKVTGELLHNVKRHHGGDDDFVGHIGGDDFVFITAPEKASLICENIIQEFDRVIPYFYSEEDRSRGHIQTTDRYGVSRQFPIMTISIAVVSDVSRDILSPTEIAQVAAEIKEYVKAMPGSNYLVDRRRSVRKSLANQPEA